MGKILIVDDSKTERENLYQIVSDAGYQVDVATCGQDAVEQIRRNKPSLVFLDVVMDDLDGFKVCRTIKAEDAIKDTPVVFVTSKKEKADKRWGEMLGAKGYITKPYSVDQIVDSLKNYA
ncbi:response regulator transcription factor [Aliikangiella coralliicola]|uniref:Response regulator n=1 Tax=Aliikangiella coralliicola TaxID=2592383 RepID=A0A545UHX3_9GAMM|nr:response regulator [Aliikangiella coralliicola]TQV89074.1 response regulator [Aliikangiella coralliicola]